MLTDVPPRPADRTTLVDRGSFSGSGAMLGGGLAVLAALLVGAWFFLRPKDPGTLQFATDPADVVVVFDGQAVQASSSPFSITVDPETPHLLEVNKVGYRTYSTQVTLRAGEARTLPMITLQSDGSAAAQQVQVAFASEPVGADVVLVRGRDRLVIGRTPIQASVNVAGDPWTVELTLDGYETWRGGLNVPAGHSTMALAATLRPRTAANEARPASTVTTNNAVAQPIPVATPMATPPPTTTSSSTGSSTTTASNTTSNNTATSNTAMAATAETPPAATGPGTLRVNSTPWSQVYVDGRLIGNTPQMNIQLAPGMHRITLVNPDFNIRENQNVMIESGQVVTRVIRLTAPESAPAPTP